MRASTYQLLSMLSYTTSWFSEWTKSSVSPAGRSIALYLTGRFFSVRVWAATSSSLPMATGVPCTWLSPRPHAVYCMCRSSRSTDIRLWCSLPWICWRYSVVYQGVSTMQRRPPLAYCKNVSKNGNTGSGTMYCYWIQANLPLYVSAYLADWGIPPCHHRYQ